MPPEESSGPPDPPKPKRTRKPLSAPELVARGWARLEKRRKADARADFTLATQLDPTHAAAWEGLLSVAKTQDEQREYLQRLLEISPDNVQGRALQAEYDAQEAQAEQRQRELEQWLEAQETQRRLNAQAVEGILTAAKNRHRRDQQAVWFIVGGVVTALIVFVIWANATRPPAPTYTAPSNNNSLSQPAAPRPAAPPSTGTRRTGAICADGTTSSATGRGACSHHGGVSRWLYSP
jgi:hypothetical protein